MCRRAPGSVVIAERLEIGIQSGLGAGLRADCDGFSEVDQGGVRGITPGGDGGEKIQSEVVTRFLGQDASSEYFGSPVVAEVQRGSCGCQPFFDGLRRWRLPPQLTFTVVEVDPGAVQQPTLGREPRNERPEHLAGVAILVPLRRLHRALKSLHGIRRRACWRDRWRTSPCNGLGGDAIPREIRLGGLPYRWASHVWPLWISIQEAGEARKEVSKKSDVDQEDRLVRCLTEIVCFLTDLARMRGSTPVAFATNSSASSVRHVVRSRTSA